MQACQIPACLYAGYQKDIKSLLYEGRWGGLAGGFCLGCLKQRFCLDMRLKGCIFFLFYDVFRRIPTQKQLFLSGLRHSVALGMEDFCAYATLLDFGDNLRCMKQVAGSLVRQGIFQSVAPQAAPCNLVSKAHSVTGFAKI